MDNSLFIATPDNIRERLDTFAADRSGITRSQIRRMINEGRILVNSIQEKAGYCLRDGDRVEITPLQKQDEMSLTAEDIPLDILFEDEQIVVVNKPPHMVVYPAAGNRHGTMMNALAFRYSSLASVGAPLRPGVVHRLDRDTSGVIVVAKEDSAYYSLVSQFKQRETEKEYIALLYGRLAKNEGTIRAPIGRSPSDRKKMSTHAHHGKEAVTKYRVMEHCNSATLVSVRLLTGRTHQIRVHFASKGHPVLGDRTYGKKTRLRLGQRVAVFNRQMLHAYSLILTHPATGRLMEFIAPLPEDMKLAVASVKIAS